MCKPMAIIYINWVRKDGKSFLYTIHDIDEEGNLEAIPIETCVGSDTHFFKSFRCDNDFINQHYTFKEYR